LTHWICIWITHG